MKKQMSWKTKGMNRDMSVSAFSPEFSFENRNLRLSTNEGNTMLSWVNEKGTKNVTIHMNGGINGMEGFAIGTAVLNRQLIVFTAKARGNKPDRIYRFWYGDNSNGSVIEGEILYSGNLNFDVEHPIETLVRYEAEHIQKVYWTDGINQPRVINIAATNDKKRHWNDQYFDFVPAYDKGNIVVTKEENGGGLFAPGVIQYCFSYYNKYGQQTNIVDVSPLYYITHSNRGASPEDKVSNSFKLDLQVMDFKFDYVRLYSIQRTSLNGDVIVKLLDDLPITTEGGYYLTYIDNGMTGSLMDYSELMFIGGKEITALTLQDKDNTLFLGNCGQKNALIKGIQDYFDSIRINGSSSSSTNEQLSSDDDEGVEPTYNVAHFEYRGSTKQRHEILDGVYNNHFTLNENNRKVTTFKGGDTYRLGFQLQKQNGEWLEPVFMDDIRNTFYPSTKVASATECDVYLPYAEAHIDLGRVSGIDLSLFKRIRPVIVYPTIADREVLCQGVLNPTVFNSMDRIDKYPFAQASWYFRPYTSDGATTYQEFDADSKISVTLQSVDTSIASNANPLGMGTINLYAALVSVGNDDVENFMKSGYIQVNEVETWHNSEDTREESTDETSYINLWGAFKVSSDDRDTKVLVLSEHILTPENSWNDNLRSYSYRWINCQYIGSSGSTNFPIYDSLYKTTNNRRIFVYNGSDVNNYTFECCVADNPYASYQGEDPHYTKATVVLTKVDSLDTIESSEGASVAFTHYDSLYSNIFTEKLIADKPWKIEIQNSSQLYGSPFSTEKVKTVPGEYNRLYDADTNTEFFVDQSIVTLNSPDIEFDTTVQTYDTENLHLRIIGAVPITANVSAHHITASSERGITPGGISGSYELNKNVYHQNSSSRQNGSNRLVADTLWNDIWVGSIKKNEDGTDNISIHPNVQDYYVYPWQKIGSLTNDTRAESEAYSWLQQKKESNALYSMYSEYLSIANTVSYNNIGMQVHLWENDYLINYRLPKQMSQTSEINYYPNIDKVLYNKNAVPVRTTDELKQDITCSVSMKYKSGSHAVISMNSVDGVVPILPYCSRGGTNIGKFDTSQNNHTTFWGDVVSFSQREISSSTLPSTNMDFLWLGEIYKDVSNPFGGKSKSSVLASKWQIGGKAELLVGGKARIVWSEGDTYYQRYDCLKTYAFTKEDTNQLVEILSFMCESHVNLDGRYDKNRGQTDNTDMNPTIFNMRNPVYDQQDNFFTYRKLDAEDVKELKYPNQVLFTKTKNNGSDIDLWTNITLANSIELDGDKGEVTSLERLNNQLIAFQDTGISQILYNENVQVSTNNGAPIELANSGKVQGVRYYSDNVGCSNKWSIASTPMGLYFIDSYEKSIYLFNGQLQNLSVQKGFNSWSKQYIPSPEITWNPQDFANFVTYYDKTNQDVLFISKATALAYSEKFGVFTSFYDYGSTPYFAMLDDKGLWLQIKKYIITSGQNSQSATTIGFTSMWQHQKGEYCNFFGQKKPYSMTLVGNPEPLVDKTFTNLEFRACVTGEGDNGVDVFDETFDYTFHPGDSQFVPYLPFDFLETWDEYQHGYATLSYKNGRGSMMHHLSDATAHLDRKFRIWRCDIPRDNLEATKDQAPASTTWTRDVELGITRFAKHPMDRMRNPWLYIKLKKSAAGSDDTMNKTEIHDMVLTYYS